MTHGIAAYKDLCIDALDAHALARFWAPLLGWTAHLHDDGDASLRDGDRVQVWVNRVPEPVTTKNRLHLDVNAESIDEALTGGARVVDDSQPWTVMRDPDGQVFCLFIRDEPVTRRPYELVWDVTGGPAECRRLADWWGDVLGVEAGHDGPPDEYSWLEEVPGFPFEYLVFQPVPEPKTVKNRLHIDVTAESVEPLLQKGATIVRPKGPDLGWHVLRDPASNEFCAFTED
jgi:hypothetical protein